MNQSIDRARLSCSDQPQLVTRSIGKVMFPNSLTRVMSRTNKLVKKSLLKVISPNLVSAQVMSDEAFLAKFNLEGIVEPSQQGNVFATKEALLAYYGRRVTPSWPTFPNMISDQNIKIYELSPQELVTRANAILENRLFFGLFNEPKLTRAGMIDWTFDPTRSASREWLWLLNRHSWWPILALAYTQTRNERYATAFVAQMLDWIETNPPPPQKNEQSSAWRLMEIGLRMRISWIPSFALFYDSLSFTAEAKLKMLRSIYDHAQFLFLFKTNRNHLLRESNGLAYVSTYFPEFEEANLWQQTALSRLEQELREQVNPDGSHIEISTGYQWLVIDEFQTTYDLLQTNELSLPRENLYSWLEKMYHVLAYVVRPDGSYPQLNDGFLFWEYTRLAKAGEIFGRSDFSYIGSGGSQGTCPTNTSVGFEDAGWYVMRSDWTGEARYLLFDAGPYGGPHGHEDKLSFELFAYGQPFIVDPGTYTYNQLDPFRTFFVSSASHNLITVDGKSQIRRWRKRHLNPQPAAGNHATWISDTGFDYVTATYDEGFGDFDFKSSKEAVIDDVIHTRHILFVKPDYWVMVDELQANDLHDYQLLFHTSPEIRATVGPENRVVLGTSSDGPSLYLVPLDFKDAKVHLVVGREDPIQGWYASPSDHTKSPATTVVYKRQSRSATVMTTLLCPCPAGKTAEIVTIEPLSISGGQGFAFVVTTGRGKDYLMLSPDDKVKQFGPFQSRAIVTGIRTNNDGKILSQFSSGEKSNLKILE